MSSTSEMSTVSICGQKGNPRSRDDQSVGVPDPAQKRVDGGIEDACLKHATRVTYAGGSPANPNSLKGDAALPGDEVVLIKLLGLGSYLPAGNFDNQLQDRLADFLDRGFARMTAPVSISMMSDMRSARLVLVETLITGATGLPVGVPRPVVKTTTLAPAPTCAVTHSTSFPGVQSKAKRVCRHTPDSRGLRRPARFHPFAPRRRTSSHR